AADTPARLALAESTLGTKLSNAPLVKAILGHDHGQSARSFASVNDEDRLGLGGHVTQKHAFGMGILTDVQALGLRGLRGVPPPQPPGKAGAFDSLADADSAVAAGLKSKLSASNWSASRDALFVDGQLRFTAPLSSKGTALTGGKVTQDRLPFYKG